MSWTNNKLSVFCAALSALLCNAASANIEPSSYDAKSIAAGTTGMAYLDSPSALAINPANLAGIDRGGMSVNITPVFSVSQAPLAGPNSEVQSDLGFGPIPSLFGAVRVADRVVLGFGAYALGIFGAKYSNVQDLYGEPGATGDFEVVGVAIEIISSLDLGLTLRVPFAWQKATMPAELGGTLIPTTATLGGAGWPGGRIGLTWRATPMIGLRDVPDGRDESPERRPSNARRARPQLERDLGILDTARAVGGRRVLAAQPGADGRGRAARDVLRSV
jgi:hypothetical protein